MRIVEWISLVLPLVAWTTALAALVEWRSRGSGAMAVVTVVLLAVSVAGHAFGVVSTVLTVPFDEPGIRIKIITLVISEVLNRGCWTCGSGLPPAVTAAGVLVANFRRTGRGLG